MKKLWIGIAAAVAVLAIGGFALTRIAEQKLHKALADIPGAQIDFKKVSLSPILGNLEFRDVEITLRDSTHAVPDVQGRIEAISLEQLRWRSLVKGEANAKRLVIRGPMAQLVLHPVPVEPKPVLEDSTARSAKTSFLQKVSLSELRVEKAAIGVRSEKDSLKVSAQDMAFSVRDFSVLLAENRVEYNDSSYCFSLDSLDYTDAPGLSRVQIGHLASIDAGPVKAHGIHAYNCVPKEQLAEKMGKVAAMWYDAKLDSVYISPLDISRMMSEHCVDIDSVSVAGKEVVLFQDDRYLPAVPYTTIQESLNALDIPLHIRTIRVQVPSFAFIWETTHINRGTFPMRNVQIAINSISNAPDNRMKLRVNSGHAPGSRLNFSMNIRNDKRETTSGAIQIYNMDVSRLDGFIRPLFGATIEADIHQIDCSFKGDKHQMTSNFCMLYDNLKVKVWNDATAPYQIVAKNSGAVSFLANLVLPKSNPSKAGKDPKKVEVVIERDPMPPYASYILQNLTQGMLYTMLPGGGHVRKTQK